jgi:uroporphyrinogen-III synthase
MALSGSSSVFAGFRFPREVIAVAVRWYLRYGLSYRDVEELLAERGITVDHVTVYRWVQRFSPPQAPTANATCERLVSTAPRDLCRSLALLKRPEVTARREFASRGHARSSQA